MIHTSHFTFTDHIHTYHSHISFTPIIHTYYSQPNQHLTALGSGKTTGQAPYGRSRPRNVTALTPALHQHCTSTAPTLHQHPTCKQQTTSHDPGHGITTLHPCVLCVFCVPAAQVLKSPPHGSTARVLCRPMASRHPMASCHLADLRPSHLSFTLHIHTYHSHLSFTVTFTAYGTTSTSPQHPKCVGDFGTGDTHPHPVYIYMYLYKYIYICVPALPSMAHHIIVDGASNPHKHSTPPNLHPPLLVPPP